MNTNKSYQIEVNTIGARGLPKILKEYIETRKVLKEIETMSGGSIVVAYDGGHQKALQTIAWFMFGSRPEALKKGNTNEY